MSRFEDQFEDQHVHIATLIGAHGIKGQARLKCFTQDPFAIGDYAQVLDANGQAYVVTPENFAKGVVTARIKGLRYRDQIEALVGLKLYVPLEQLPATEDDEFYSFELEGLEARLADGRLFGEVLQVLDYGAGDLLSVRRHDTGKTELYAFTRQVVPQIHIEQGYLVIDPPPFSDET